MKLLNNGGETIITFDGGDVVIPAGIFEVEDNIGNYILRKVVSLGLNVRSFDEELEAQRAKEVEEEVKEEIKETEEVKEVKEEIKEPKKVVKKVVKKAKKKK